MNDPEVSGRMREDWNRRAREDANYYVAFGRREQDDEEFFATGAEVVAAVEWELKRFPRSTNSRALRALEVGCGPGRLMRPLSRRFGEIHGVDVSDEMIRLAREKLRGIPHAHVHLSSGADLAQFADESFDVVYSYAVFQHIPSRDVVWSYLSEIVRVLKPGGVFRGQLNGLPAESIASYDTWSGVSFTAGEIAGFARDRQLQLLALEGVRTQYMWTTWRKAPPGTRPPSGRTRIRRVTNARSSEPVAPASGRFAALSLWVEGLPEDADLKALEIRVAGSAAFGSYIGPPDADGLQQLNVMLPGGLGTGLQPVEVFLLGKTLGEPGRIRITPPPPPVPRILSVTDGVSCLSGTRIVTGSVKITIEETMRPEELSASVDGVALTDRDTFCADPLPPRYEINFRLPKPIVPGHHRLEVYLGRRRFAPVEIEVG